MLPTVERAVDDEGTLTCSAAELRAAGRKVVRAGRKQIALFWHDGQVFACNNRCPHEGYPLVEGSLSERNGAACALTCNWHSWAFDLRDGQNLTGGDDLRTYPARIAGDEVVIDVRDPPALQRQAKALAALRGALERLDHGRIARELARLQAADGDAMQAVRVAIGWTHDRFEFGTTHAHAALADWLALRSGHATTAAEALVAVTEGLYALGWDSLREQPFPFATGEAPYDADTLVAAIEAQDESAAVRLVRGGLRTGSWPLVEPALARAALAHYADFGHSAIYTYKTRQLIELLGEEVAEPLALLLVRSIINAWREDLIPEFRHYATALAAWQSDGGERPSGDDIFGFGVKPALDLTARSGGDIAGLYAALLHANALNFLHFDVGRQQATRQPVSRNTGWLDFTHGITFANAVRALCEEQPALWPQGLLQMACFAGRNVRFIDIEHDYREWAVEDGDAFLAATFKGLFDHAQPEPIVSAHLVKLTTAVAEEAALAPDAAYTPVLLAALNRFLHSPLKRHHALRSAEQALGFVAAEG
jgi:nitrite reductase/ring-hydroxylating ferredoxin subunit